MSWEQFEESVQERWAALADEADAVRQMGQRVSEIVRAVGQQSDELDLGEWFLRDATLLTGRVMVAWKCKRRPDICVYLVVNIDLSGHISSDNDGGDLEAEFDADVYAGEVASDVVSVMIARMMAVASQQDSDNENS
jgi:hypothetical protein